MKSIARLLILTLCMALPAISQSQRKKTPAPKPNSARPAVNTKAQGRMAGANISITTNTGGQVAGSLIDLNTNAVRIKTGEFESTIGLESVASISFRTPRDPVSGASAQASSESADFAGDVETVSSALDTMAASVKSGFDYSEYGRRLTDLRRLAERRIGKYSSSENAAESKFAALLAGALVDYTWARTIWTLKLGSAGSALVSDADSPVVGDALALYPDLKTAAASGDKLSADKLVVGLLSHATAKGQQIRLLANPSR
jgi:hypothetical protein